MRESVKATRHNAQPKYDVVHSQEIVRGAKSAVHDQVHMPRKGLQSVGVCPVLLVVRGTVDPMVDLFTIRSAGRQAGGL